MTSSKTGRKTISNHATVQQCMYMYKNNLHAMQSSFFPLYIKTGTIVKRHLSMHYSNLPIKLRNDSENAK